MRMLPPGPPATAPFSSCDEGTDCPEKKKGGLHGPPFGFCGGMSVYFWRYAMQRLPRRFAPRNDALQPVPFDRSGTLVPSRHAERSQGRSVSISSGLRRDPHVGPCGPCYFPPLYPHRRPGGDCGLRSVSSERPKVVPRFRMTQGSGISEGRKEPSSLRPSGRPLTAGFPA